MLHDGPTALTLARNAAIRPGERVLVTGAAGGLGILLVQLAIAAGGHVVAAARGERKLELLRAWALRRSITAHRSGHRSSCDKVAAPDRM